MTKINKLIEVAGLKGLDVMGFDQSDFYEWTVRYLNPDKAGEVPVLEFCRDEKDFELKMKAWIKDGTDISPAYPDFDTLLSDEIKRLRKL